MPSLRPPRLPSERHIGRFWRKEGSPTRNADTTKEKSLIAPAVWIDDDAIITEAEQDLRLAELPEGEIRLIFPARLVPDKGSDVILAAVEHAETLLPVNAPRITLDIIGTGPLSKDCRTFAERHEGRIAVNYFEPVSYGVEFFKLLRSYCVFHDMWPPVPRACGQSFHDMWPHP